MKKYFKAHCFESIFAFVIVIAIAFAISIKFEYVYSTNDDVMMRNILNGNFSGTTDGHLIFISYLLTSFWKLMYYIWPNVSWYDVFMVGIHYLCWFFIIARLGSFATAKKWKTILMLSVTMLLVVIDFKYLIAPQFTVVSAQLAGVAVLWILTGKRDTKTECLLDYVVICSALLASAMYRKEPFLVALPVVGIVLVWDIWKRAETKEALCTILKRTAIFLGIFCLSYIIVLSVEKAAYSSSEWSEFSRSQVARPQVYDYSVIPSLSDYESRYEELGLDYSDWMAIYTYNCELAENFNADIMEGVAEIVIDHDKSWRAVSNSIDIYKKDFYQFCYTIFQNEIQPIGMCLSIGYILALLLCYKSNDKKTGLEILLILCFYFAVFLYLIDRGRMPERVLYGMHFMQLMCLLPFILKHAEKIYQNLKSNLFWSVAILSFCGVAFVFSFTYSWQIAKEEHAGLLQNATDWEYINDYFEGHPENRYCLDTASFVFSTEKLFSDKIESDNMIRMGGWMLNSPLQNQRMEQQGADDLLNQLAEDEHFYVVQEANKDTTWLEIIYGEKEYEVEAVVVDLIETPGGRTFEIIQMQ